MKKIILAIPKGRILSELDPLLKKINLIPDQDFYSETSRKLIFTTNHQNIEIVKVRSFDVATFVKFGGADVGICGSDVIEEFISSEFFAIFNLEIGKCRLSIAKKNNSTVDLSRASHIRIATKYPEIAKKFFAKRNIQAEIIKLNGSIEIAPQLNLCDFILDLVSTGKTLQENDISEIEKIMDVSSYLIANRASLKTKNYEINLLLEMFNEK